MGGSGWLRLNLWRSQLSLICLEKVCISPLTRFGVRNKILSSTFGLILSLPPCLSIPFCLLLQRLFVPFLKRRLDSPLLLPSFFALRPHLLLCNNLLDFSLRYIHPCVFVQRLKDIDLACVEVSVPTVCHLFVDFAVFGEAEGRGVGVNRRRGLWLLGAVSHHEPFLVNS